MQEKRHRVLRKTPKPPTQSTVPNADEIEVGSSHQDEVPETPVTPVSAEGLVSLHNLIKQDVHTLNEASIQRIERLVQKLAHAALVSFAERAFLRAEGALLENRNQMLIKLNNEAKVRRSTRSVVLGKAKVMSYEDIEEARKKRAAKDAKKGKGKRGRKCKSAALEADELEADEEEPEPEPEVARTAKEATKGKGKRGRKRKSASLKADELDPEPEQKVAQMIGEPEQEVAQTIKTPEPWRAPVAHKLSGAPEGNPGAGKYQKARRRLRNEMARQRKLLLVEIVDRFKKEQPVIDSERQLSGKVVDEDTRGALERSGQMTPE
ncbi:hypothetical protein MMC17_004339 [Xylographa soralifera]|nr:hypothetical protein [Xylographa soralifera]